MWLQVTKSKVWIGKDLFHTFLIQNYFNKECLLPILLKFSVELELSTKPEKPETELDISVSVLCP